MVGLSESGETRIRYSFGCHTVEAGMFRSQQANGIYGLAVSKSIRSFIEGMSVRPYIDILYQERKIDNRVFSVCLGKNGTPLRY